MTMPIDQNISSSAPEHMSRTLSLSDSLSYSAPYIAMIWLSAPIHIVQGVYAKYYGFSLATLASIVLLARMFDAVTDPLIGYYSDYYHRRTGTRKPFVVIGGLLLLVSCYFLYVPVGIDQEAPVKVSVTYFTLWFMAFYFALTLFEIPHGAWASELALTSVEKAKIFSFRSVAGSLGMVLFYLVPLLPFFDTQDITPETLEVTAVAAAVLMLPLLYWCIKKTPDSSSVSANNRREFCSNKKNLDTLHFLLRSILDNKPLLIFFGAFLAYGFAAGMWYSLIFIYVDSYLGLGENFAQVFLFSFVASILITPLWYKLSVVFSKKIILSVAMILLITSFVYAPLLTPDMSGFHELLILQMINTLGGSCMVAFAPSMLSEIIDYSAWKYRTDCTASYYALFIFLGKFNIAVGAFMGLAIAGWYGVDATGTTQTAEGILGLMLGMAWLPIVFMSIALVLIVLSPINAHRHGIIRQRLDARIFRENHAIPLTPSTPSNEILAVPYHKISSELAS